MAIEISGRSRFVRANGLRHHLLDYGRGDKGTIVLLPGITSPAATADFIAVPLSEMGFRVVVPDLRGRGQTDIAPPGSYRIEDYAADVAGLIDVLDITDEIVIGHSLGARIAAAYAVLHSPEKPPGLVLIDPPTSGPDRGPYPTTRESFLAQMNEAKRGSSVEEIRRFYPKWPERELRLRLEVLPGCDETAVLETHAGFENEDFFPFWTKLKRPAVLLRGADSPVVPPAAAADLAAANPTIPIIAIPNAGHMIPWDNFRGFFEAVTPVLTGGRKH
ncbi:alpha/beta fold hydrolase [Rhizobium puerariae]|uniref:Alpha/beta fold hydrolase n=1 Tax=Rhizobium puerariae TaxID=1585791 RepID=A0ABV6AF49_9HYPH